MQCQWWWWRENKSFNKRQISKQCIDNRKKKKRKEKNLQTSSCLLLFIKQTSLTVISIINLTSVGYIIINRSAAPPPSRSRALSTAFYHNTAMKTKWLQVKCHREEADNWHKPLTYHCKLRRSSWMLSIPMRTIAFCVKCKNILQN